MTKNYKNGILEIVFNKKQESKPNDGAKSRIKENQDIRRQNHNMQKSRISSTSSVSTPSDYVRYAPSTILKAGTPAPDFTLHSTPDQKVSLSQFYGRAVILAFYPADWSRVCGDEMTLFNEILERYYEGYDDDDNNNKIRFEVSSYNNPLAALSEFKPNFYDLLLIDINMPDINGFELCQKMLKSYA